MMGVTDASPRTGDLFFAIAAAFLFGVLAANMAWNMVLLGLVGTFCVIVALVFFRIKNFWKYAALLFFAAAAGVFYYHIYISRQAAYEHMPAGKEAAFFGVVTEEPKTAGNFIMLAVSLVRPYAGTVDIFVSPNDAQFKYGDELWVQGTITASDGTNEPPAVFLPRMRVIAQHEGLWLREALIDFKEGIMREVAGLLPADQAALLSGIMIGTTGIASAALKAQMELSGTTYIVALYGYKIAIITLALTAMLKDHVSRKALVCVLLVAIALFYSYLRRHHFRGSRRHHGFIGGYCARNGKDIQSA